MDLLILFFTRTLRMFSYGCISVIFIKQLLNKGLDQSELSILQASIVIGDIFISILLTTQADKIGRKKTLIFGGLLKFLTGIAYAYTSNFIILMISGIIGVISVNGGQIGPFMPIQHSCLTQIVQQKSISEIQTSQKIARLLGYYNMFGYLSKGAGALVAGYYIGSKAQDQITINQGMTNIMLFYAFLGLLKAFLYNFLTPSIQATKTQEKKITFAGIKRKNIRNIVTLSILFAVDNWAGGFVMQSFLSYYFDVKLNVKFADIGILLSICNLVGGLSGLLTASLVKKFGAIATMIFTHLPSNIMLLLIPFCGSFYAQLFLILRFCISQMDIPARQTYVTMSVSSSERSAANGITNVARSVGLSLSFPIAGIFLKQPPQSFSFSYPFIIAGTATIIYDIALGFCFLLKKEEQTKKSQKFHHIQEFQEKQFTITGANSENQITEQADK